MLAVVAHFAGYIQPWEPVPPRFNVQNCRYTFRLQYAIFRLGTH